jgi:hypothetical protein
VLGSSGGIDYERERYARALAAAPGGDGGSGMDAVVKVFPVTHSWLRGVLQQVQLAVLAIAAAVLAYVVLPVASDGNFGDIVAGSMLMAVTACAAASCCKEA